MQSEFSFFLDGTNQGVSSVRSLNQLKRILSMASHYDGAPASQRHILSVLFESEKKCMLKEQAIHSLNFYFLWLNVLYF